MILRFRQTVLKEGPNAWKAGQRGRAEKKGMNVNLEASRVAGLSTAKSWACGVVQSLHPGTCLPITGATQTTHKAGILSQGGCMARSFRLALEGYINEAITVDFILAFKELGPLISPFKKTPSAPLDELTAARLPPNPFYCRLN